jgi:hypothetical protein
VTGSKPHQRLRHANRGGHPAEPSINRCCLIPRGDSVRQYSLLRSVKDAGLDRRFRPPLSSDGYRERLELKSGSPGYAQTWDAVTKATALGFYGGLGFELGISKEVSLLIEAQTRRAKISGFSGTSKEKFNQSEYEESFDLYYYEFYSSYLENSYKFLNFPNAERGFNLRALRDAIIDLSGFSLNAGIKIHL